MAFRIDGRQLNTYIVISASFFLSLLFLVFTFYLIDKTRLVLLGNLLNCELKWDKINTQDNNKKSGTAFKSV